MTFDAWFQFHDDNVIANHPTAARVYARLLRNPDIFFEPQDVKTWLLAEQLHTSRKGIGRALNLLVKRGYAIEKERGQNYVRRILLVRERITRSPNDTPSAA